MSSQAQENYMSEHLSTIPQKSWWHDTRYSHVESLISDLPPKSLLDIGCGNGGFLSHLSQQPKFNRTNLFGYDENVRFESADSQFEMLSRLPKDQEFNCITMLDVLEHIDDDLGYLKTITNRLDKDGIFIATVPAFQILYSWWDRKLGHFRRYSLPELVRLVNDAGLKVSFSTYFFSYLFLPSFLRRFFPAPQAEFKKPRPFIYNTLMKVGAIEQECLRHFPIPFGTSILVVAKHEI